MERAEKVRRLLDNQGWSKAQLANRAGLNQRNVGYILSGKREPGVSFALAIARALNADVAWLFDDSREWPPKKQASATTLSDMELVEELASRRDSVRRDIATLNGRFPRDRLKRLNRLAAKKHRVEAEDAELTSGLAELIQAHSVGNRLTGLNPDHVYPPKGQADRVYALFFDLEHLRERFERALQTTTHVEDARVAGFPGLVPDDGSVPRHPGPPQLVSPEYLAGSGGDGTGEVADFIPLLWTMDDAPPVRGTDGLYPDDIADAYIHLESADPNAFACRVAADSAVPSSTRPGSVRIVKGSSIIADNLNTSPPVSEESSRSRSTQWFASTRPRTARQSHPPRDLGGRRSEVLAVERRKVASDIPGETE